MARAVLVLSLSGLLGCSATAGVTGSSVPVASGADPAFSDEELASIDEVFTQWNEPDRPGCAVALIRGEAVVHRTYGLADIESDAPLTPETLFDIASTSKQFTAAAIALPILDGELSLDDEDGLTDCDDSDCEVDPACGG